jgi:hypothetical protein
VPDAIDSDGRPKRVAGGFAEEERDVVGEAPSTLTCGTNWTLGRRPSPVAGWRVGLRQAGTKEVDVVWVLALRSGRIDGAIGRERGDGGAGEERGEGVDGIVLLLLRDSD